MVQKQNVPIYLLLFQCLAKACREIITFDITSFGLQGLTFKKLLKLMTIMKNLRIRCFLRVNPRVQLFHLLFQTQSSWIDYKESILTRETRDIRKLLIFQQVINQHLIIQNQLYKNIIIHNHRKDLKCLKAQKTKNKIQLNQILSHHLCSLHFQLRIRMLNRDFLKFNMLLTINLLKKKNRKTMNKN